MIGVIADESERAVASEFFELFKTPWEWWQCDRKYDVILCSVKQKLDACAAKLILLYSGSELPYDGESGLGAVSQRCRCNLVKGEIKIPLYGNCVTFTGETSGSLFEENSKHSAMHQWRNRNGLVLRIGYDLFGEIELLLNIGQPAENARIPTLDLHIALLRQLIVSSGIQLIEIPPIPDGYSFIACLTHDVDHPSIRRHKLDHTVAGFLYRSVLGSAFDFLRRRIPFRDLRRNWIAALKLPFVQTGFAKDFWLDFADRYLKLENGLHSTFFVIPVAEKPGNIGEGPAPRFRASRYGSQDIATPIRKLMAVGCEVGLHGIDAWRDSSTGRDEIDEIRRLTDLSEIGVRMHWLYYDQDSPSVLERAGAAYDSSIGYRETVGFRTGTTQVFKPLHATRLLELPMHVMDTALFYPAYLGLSSQEATEVLHQFTEQLSRAGGCFTVNWHDRSLAPERLWYACYLELLGDLKSRNTWFATAAQAVAWFQKRRSVVFETDGMSTEVIRARITTDDEDNLPEMRLRIHKTPRNLDIRVQDLEYLDTAFNIGTEILVSSGKRS